MNHSSQRWGRLYKILTGDEKSSNKTRGTTSRSGGRTPKQKTLPDKKTSTAKVSKESGDVSDEIDGKATTQSVAQTPKKRAHNGDVGSEVEDDTPTKVKKVEIKDEEDV